MSINVNYAFNTGLYYEEVGTQDNSHNEIRIAKLFIF